MLSPLNSHPAERGVLTSTSGFYYSKSMGMCSSSVFCAAILLVLFLSVVCGKPLVPALFLFGDSAFDVGNNNNLNTIIKSNFPPYGRDFRDHKPTGRFCNGKLAIDFVAEILGFASYPPAYLSEEAKGNNLLTGANFASASSGYYQTTPTLYNAISLTQQIENYKELQNELVKIAGKSNASSITSGAIHLVTAGSSDFIQNYYINPFLFLRYSTDEFSDLLMQSYTEFIQDLYDLGATRIGVTTLPPLGCLPAAITAFGFGSGKCVERLNTAALAFNEKLNATSQRLQKRLSGLKLVVLDIYQPLYGLISEPAKNGFSEARQGCCGTGYIETSILCNSKSFGTCKNATEYVFWDSFHPSEAANKKLSQDLLAAGVSLIF